LLADARAWAADAIFSVCIAAVFNSKYDAWQLGSEFQSNWKTKAEQDGVIQYGKDFMAQLAPVYTGGETKNGGMITVSRNELARSC
jgi:hypothetical protein